MLDWPRRVFVLVVANKCIHREPKINTICLLTIFKGSKTRFVFISVDCELLVLKLVFMLCLQYSVKSIAFSFSSVSYSLATNYDGRVWSQSVGLSSAFEGLGWRRKWRRIASARPIRGKERKEGLPEFDHENAGIAWPLVPLNQPHPLPFLHLGDYFVRSWNVEIQHASPLSMKIWVIGLLWHNL